MEGQVNATLEAQLRLEVLGSAAAPSRAVVALIDTGFNGFLTLARSVIAELKLPWLYRHHGELADGTIQVFEVFEATVVWNGQEQSIEVEAVDTEPLLGMALMAGHELRIEIKVNGPVTVAPLPGH